MQSNADQKGRFLSVTSKRCIGEALEELGL